jgi:CO/xanthine dehydrogenase Mo-binding subunit
VAYEDLPVLFDTREAVKPDAPLIHGKRPGNLVGRFDFGWDDVEQESEAKQRASGPAPGGPMAVASRVAPPATRPAASASANPQARARGFAEDVWGCCAAQP